MFIDWLYTLKEIKADKYVTGGIWYMLADNEQPMDCGFDCDTFTANQTINDLDCVSDCDIQRKSGLGFMLVTLVIVVIAGLLLFCEVETTDHPRPHGVMLCAVMTMIQTSLIQVPNVEEQAYTFCGHVHNMTL
jgi:hypothetical protein